MAAKTLLLLYKRLIQPYPSLLWLLLATHFQLLLGSCLLMHDIDGKSHNTETKSSHNYSTYHLKPLLIYGLRGGHTHTHTHASTYFGGMKVISRNQAHVCCESFSFLKANMHMCSVSFIPDYSFLYSYWFNPWCIIYQLYIYNIAT